MDRRRIPLHQNESYWLLPEDIVKECSSCERGAFSTYPIYDDLRADIASYAQVAPERISITPGSDAAIRAIAEIMVETKARAFAPIPTFYGYERIFSLLHVPVTFGYYEEKDGRFMFPLDATLQAIQDGIEFVFLCNPNNPLGERIPSETMTQILDAARSRGTRVVVDEAYAEFTNDSVIPLLNTLPLVVLRTFSKSFGLPGARVGYAVADQEFIALLNARLLPWPVTGMSVHAARVALKHRDVLKERRALLVQEREHFAESLASVRGMRVYPSHTNFVLCRINESARIIERLKEQNILTVPGERLSFDEKGRNILSSTIRCAVPSPQDRETVLTAIKAVCA